MAEYLPNTCKVAGFIQCVRAHTDTHCYTYCRLSVLGDSEVTVTSAVNRVTQENTPSNTEAGTTSPGLSIFSYKLGTMIWYELSLGNSTVEVLVPSWWI